MPETLIDGLIELFLANANVTLKNPYLDTLKETVCSIHPGGTRGFQLFAETKPDPTWSNGETKVKDPFVIVKVDYGNAHIGYSKPWAVPVGLRTVSLSNEALGKFDPIADDKQDWYADRGIDNDDIRDTIEVATGMFVVALLKSDQNDIYVQEALEMLGVNESMPMEQREEETGSSEEEEESEKGRSPSVEETDNKPEETENKAKNNENGSESDSSED